MVFSSGLSNKSIKSNAEALYTKIVRHARHKAFYEEYHVPDTVDGRFDMVVLHVFLVLRRLKEEGEATEALSQFLFDVLFENMDTSLREMGVGDLSIGKRIKKMAKAFYGRVEAYNEPLTSGDQVALAAAVKRNLYRGEAGSSTDSERFAGYMMSVWQDLKSQPRERFHLGLVAFAPDLVQSTLEGQIM